MKGPITKAPRQKLGLIPRAPLSQEFTTVWSFEQTDQEPIRYLGRCIPEIPRYCINRFSKPGDLVLDAFMGSGTAVAESIRLGRNVIGIDPAAGAIRATTRRLQAAFPARTLDSFEAPVGQGGPLPLVVRGDAREIPLP